MCTRNTHTCMSGIGSAHSGWHETEHYVVKTADWASKLGVNHTGGRGGGMTAAVAGSSGVQHVEAGQEMLSWYRTGCGPAGHMLINRFKLNCLIRVTTPRAYWMIKHRLCWYMHTPGVPGSHVMKGEAGALWSPPSGWLRRIGHKPALSM